MSGDPARKLVPVPKAELEKLLLETGLLYAINRFVLHPEGLCLAISYEDEDVKQGNPSLGLFRPGDGKPYSFESEWERGTLVPRIRAYLSGKKRPLLVLLEHYFPL